MSDAANQDELHRWCKEVMRSPADFAMFSIAQGVQRLLLALSSRTEALAYVRGTLLDVRIGLGHEFPSGVEERIQDALDVGASALADDGTRIPLEQVNPADRRRGSGNA